MAISGLGERIGSDDHFRSAWDNGDKVRVDKQKGISRKLSKEALILILIAQLIDYDS